MCGPLHCHAREVVCHVLRVPAQLEVPPGSLHHLLVAQHVPAQHGNECGEAWPLLQLDAALLPPGVRIWHASRAITECCCVATVSSERSG